MDFQFQINNNLSNRQLSPGVPLPFFMTYPGYFGAGGYGRETDTWKDMEYFRALYPAHVRKWESRIREILDRMDYEGSMIYDAYPDYLSLRNLSLAMERELEKEEELAARDTNQAAKVVETELPRKQEKEDLRSLTQVLLFQEICRRRDGKRKDPYQRYYYGIGESFSPGTQY